jgi:hypothetical protein
MNNFPWSFSILRVQCLTQHSVYKSYISLHTTWCISETLSMWQCQNKHVEHKRGKKVPLLREPERIRENEQKPKLPLPLWLPGIHSSIKTSNRFRSGSGKQWKASQFHMIVLGMVWSFHQGKPQTLEVGGQYMALGGSDHSMWAAVI